MYRLSQKTVGRRRYNNFHVHLDPSPANFIITKNGLIEFTYNTPTLHVPSPISQNAIQLNFLLVNVMLTETAEI